jgi:nitrous oxidase accessory protein NosD
MPPENCKIKKEKIMAHTLSRHAKESHLLLYIFAPILLFSLPLTAADSAQKHADLDITPSEITVLRGSLDYGSQTPITINHPGTYKLVGPLTATGSTTALTISANNVFLDLDGYAIAGGATGITITGNAVTIKNGTVNNASSIGIKISGSACKLENLDVISSRTGFLLQHACENQCTDCCAYNCTNAGFSLISSSTNNFTKCQALTTHCNTANAYGFVSQQGYGNMFEFCLAQDIQTEATNPSYFAAGFLLANEQASIINECTAQGNHALSSTAAAYGIYLNNAQGCFCTKNTASKNTTSNALGIGIRAYSTTNYIAGNVSYANDTNFQDVSSVYITSQANTRGSYNTDTNLSDPDMVTTINTNANAIALQDQTITSKTDTLSSTMTAMATTIESKLDTVDKNIQTVDTYCDTINSKLDNLTLSLSKIDDTVSGGCLITGIPPNTSTTTISNEGSYCLQGYHAGAIIINASNVTLDLNGYRVGSSVTINRGFSNIVVKNGTINAITTANNSSTIYNVQLENLLCNKESDFYYITELYIHDCLFFTMSGDTTPAAAKFNYCYTIELIDCIARNNTATSPYGFYFNYCDKVYAHGCYAADLSFGFYINNSDTIDCIDCIAASNAISGFYVIEPRNINFIGCTANDNNSASQSFGFFLDGTGNASTALIRECNSERSSMGTYVNTNMTSVLFGANFSWGSVSNWGEGFGKDTNVHGAGRSQLASNPTYWTNTYP